MVKKYVFSFKLDVDDRQKLVVLANHLQRTQADAVRWLIRNAPQLKNLNPTGLDWEKYSTFARMDDDGGQDDQPF